LPLCNKIPLDPAARQLDAMQGAAEGGWWKRMGAAGVEVAGKTARHIPEKDTHADIDASECLRAGRPSFDRLPLLPLVSRPLSTRDSTSDASLGPC
jgi:hypothetical protein